MAQPNIDGGNEHITCNKKVAHHDVFEDLEEGMRFCMQASIYVCMYVCTNDSKLTCRAYHFILKNFLSLTNKTVGAIRFIFFCTIRQYGDCLQLPNAQ